MAWHGLWGRGPPSASACTAALPRILRGADSAEDMQTFFFCSSSSSSSFWTQWNEGSREGERDEGLKTATRTIDTKPFWTLGHLAAIELRRSFGAFEKWRMSDQIDQGPEVLCTVTPSRSP